MAGRYVPTVLIPRYTTLAGLKGAPDWFATGPMDVSAYSEGYVTIWRGEVIGTAPPVTTPATASLGFWFEESTDRNTWTTVDGSPNDDPGKDTQFQCILHLNKRWLRLRLKFYSDDNVGSCFAVGFLEERRA